MIKVIKHPGKSEWQEITKRPVFENVSLEKTVKKILDKVKTKGDKAVRKYTKVFDGVKLKKLAVSEKEIKAAEGLISQELKDAIEKLSLSDSALQFEPENSPVLGFGARIGFLGLLHMDIIRERLEREYDLDLVVTNPSTDYQVTLSSGDELDIKSASDLPDVSRIKEIREPWIKGEIVVPQEYIGPVIQLIISKRGLQTNISYIEERALLSFEAPLANLLTDFYDQLKSITSGYGSFNYELDSYRAEDLVRIDFYVSGEIVDALSIMAHRSEAQGLGREIVKKLKEVVPRQSFQVSLQAGIGGKFIAREDISAYRKDVTGYLYGGDVSRKKKLLAKQAKGKKRMKRFGKVDIPSEAFMVMLKRD